MPACVTRGPVETINYYRTTEKRHRADFQSAPHRLTLQPVTTMKKISRLSFLLALIALVSSAATTVSAQAPASMSLETASYLGGTADVDKVTAAVIQSDGSVILGANLTPGTKFGRFQVPAGNGLSQIGCVVKLTPNGREIEMIYAAGPAVTDLAIDEKDNIYVAAGSEGMLILDASAGKKLRQHKIGSVSRVDAAPDGHSIALAGDAGYIFSPTGESLGKANGKSYTEDVAIDHVSKTAVIVGFRNARAWEGRRVFPVQICYVFGYDFQGNRKYRLYDWDTDRESDRFLNKPTNNMADTRAYRTAIGRDGKLYVGFEAAGGNHLFRYTPTDIMTESGAVVGGDQYHSFHNSKSEHKLVFGRYDVATGEVLQVQQFCGRLSTGAANATRIKDGDITADEMGRVYITGAAAAGLPLSWQPEGVGEYSGGAFLLIMNADMNQRILCTRLNVKGSGMAIAARAIGRDIHFVYGGEAPSAEHPIYVKDPLQEKTTSAAGFFMVAREPGIVPAALAGRLARQVNQPATRPGSPGSPGARPEQAEKPEKPAVDTTALLLKNKLRSAQVYLEGNRRDLARKIAEEIIRDHPDSEQAVEARKIIETLDKPRYFQVD